MDFPIRYVSHNQMLGKYTLNMEHFWDSPELQFFRMEIKAGNGSPSLVMSCVCIYIDIIYIIYIYIDIILYIYNIIHIYNI